MWISRTSVPPRSMWRVVSVLVPGGAVTSTGAPQPEHVTVVPTDQGYAHPASARRGVDPSDWRITPGSATAPDGGVARSRRLLRRCRRDTRAKRLHRRVPDRDRCLRGRQHRRTATKRRRSGVLELDQIARQAPRNCGTRDNGSDGSGNHGRGGAQRRLCPCPHPLCRRPSEPLLRQRPRGTDAED